MGADPLSTYRRRRSPARTPEPVPAPGPLPSGADDTFVIQEHHATALHWDVRLERGGVLVSWAVPKGLPASPDTNHLAVRTEDHPLEYAAFEGDIPAAEYGGGRVLLWDRGRYETEKWEDDREVKVVLHGDRASGRYVFVHTRGRNWLLHRMDPAERGTVPVPALVRPMLAVLREDLPPDGDWAFEMKWDGVRAVVYVDGGRARVLSRNDLDVTAGYPELRELGAALGARRVVLDGEIVALDAAGRPDFGRLQERMHLTGATRVRRAAAATPVTYLVFDVLHLDGRDTTGLPWERRRELLDTLGLAGPHWQTPPAWRGDGAAVLRAAGDLGVEGVVAKRRAGVYRSGERSTDWIKVKFLRTQEVVVGGWTEGQGRRAGLIGSLLVGVPAAEGLAYAGRVGTGFTTAALRDLADRLRPLARATPPFAGPVPAAQARGAHWVRPTLVGEVRFGEWTREGRMRQPAWRGLRPDKQPAQVVREEPTGR
jgi:bifunctional non-homologous end joining protein LigD